MKKRHNANLLLRAIAHAVIPSPAPEAPPPPKKIQMVVCSGRGRYMAYCYDNHLRPGIDARQVTSRGDVIGMPGDRMELVALDWTDIISQGARAAAFEAIREIEARIAYAQRKDGEP